MVDTFDTVTRSRVMAAVKSRNTSVELRVRSFLYKRGFRFRLHVRKLPGHPDIVISRIHAVVFVNGCFWHRHSYCAYASTPESRSQFWIEKFERNVERDRNAVTKLLQDDWRVFTVWECGLKHKADIVLERLARLLNVKSCLRYELPEVPPKISIKN